MRKLGQLLIQHDETLAHLEAITMGRPTGGNHPGERAALVWEYYAGLGENVHGTTSLSTPGFINMSLRQPFGVTAGIIPWNFPVSMFGYKAAPAVAAGNSIVIKTSEKAPLAVVSARLPLCYLIEGRRRTSEMANCIAVAEILTPGLHRATHQRSRLSTRSHPNPTRCRSDRPTPLIQHDHPQTLFHRLDQYRQGNHERCSF